METYEMYSVELQPYTGNDPFAFVSYSHDETVRVEGILRILQKAGIRFWYDQQGAGIDGGSKWRRYINERLKNSSMYICFLANGVEQRQEVLREIDSAIKHKKQDASYQVLFIFLEKMPSKVFSDVGYPKIEKYIRDNQHIMYHGVTDLFIRQLLNKKVISEVLIKEEAKSQWRERSTGSLTIDSEELFPENTYICPTVFPEMDKEHGFYQVRMDQMDPDAVCLICLDNQWCPSEFYNEPLFWQQGLQWEKGEVLRTAYQTTEIFRALLHHRQLVMNRAFLYNSQVFEQWYEQGSEEYNAYRELLQDGTILVYLTLESAPYDPHHKPAFATANYDAWGKICEKIPVYCLCLDWTDPVTNRLKVEQLLFHRFESFCLTMAENYHLQDDLAVAFEFDAKQKRDFSKIWQEIQLHAAARDREDHPSYTREQFYRKFLVKKGTDVSDCILDIHKAFAPELKEIVDLQYGINLPEALGIRPIYPLQGNLKDFYRSAQILKHGARELSLDELSCAIGEFEPVFLKHRQVVDFPDVSTISLHEVVNLRKMPEWKRYIRTVSNGSKRAHLQEVDFYDISYVWERFYEWMHAARTENSKPNSSFQVDWKNLEAAVSIIYRLGNEEIITVYHASSRDVTIRTSRDADESIPVNQDHTVLVTIDYVCADVLQINQVENFMLSEQRLFEGMSKEKLSIVFAGILQRLNIMNESGQIHLIWNQKSVEERRILRQYHEKEQSSEWHSYVELLQCESSTQEQVDEDTYFFNNYVHKKEQSGEWQWYLHLMAERQRDFQQDPMLSIITDLSEICRYERTHPEVKIGVRYRSPYSLLVVDLVRDTYGKVFTYERILPTVPDGAVICIPEYEGKYVFIEQFRHAMRGYQIAFPRGYAEQGLKGDANAAKELEEELNANVRDIHYLGDIIADSGVSGNCVHVYHCKITRPALQKRYEGIRRLLFLSPEEISQEIQKGTLNDGYTLSALEMLEQSAIIPQEPGG